MNETYELVDELNDLATRFSEGWHEGIEIDASNIMTLGMAADRITELEQQRDDLDKRAHDYALQCNQYAKLNAELLDTLVKHGKHGVHCRPEYQHSTGQLIGYKCVEINCPVATTISKAMGGRYDHARSN